MPPPATPVKDHAPTVAAIAIAAACIVAIDHEAIGHGSACLASGGHIMLLSSVYFHCSRAGIWIDPAGPAINLLVGLLAFVMSRLVPRRLAHLGLLLALVTIFSLSWEAGYLLYAMSLGTGDWANAAREFIGGTSWHWRLGGIVLGLLLYGAMPRVAGIALRAFGGDASRLRGLSRLCWMAASGSAILAACLYAPARWDAAVQAALEIGLASAPVLLRPIPTVADASADIVIARSPVWIGAASILFIAFMLTLGRGVA